MVSVECWFVIVVWDIIVMVVLVDVIDVLLGVRYFACCGQFVVYHGVGVVGQKGVFALGNVV